MNSNTNSTPVTQISSSDVSALTGLYNASNVTPLSSTDISAAANDPGSDPTVGSALLLSMLAVPGVGDPTTIYNAANPSDKLSNERVQGMIADPAVDDQRSKKLLAAILAVLKALGWPF